MPQPSTKPLVIHVRIDPDIHAWLREQAGRESVGTVIRPILIRAMEEDKKAKKPKH